MREPLTFSALERMQRMKKGSAFPSASRSLLRDVWGKREKVFFWDLPRHAFQWEGVQVTCLHHQRVQKDILIGG